MLISESRAGGAVQVSTRGEHTSRYLVDEDTDEVER